MVQSQFLVVDIQKGQFNTPNRAGEYFYKLVLGDASGTIRGIAWDSSLVPPELDYDDIALVTGEVTDYHGPQIVVSCLEIVDKANVNRKHFQPSSSHDLEEMWQKLEQKIQKEVRHKKLLQLWEQISSDKDLREKIKYAPAARTIHHNYLGGLLEHTLEVVFLCQKMCLLYPEHLNASLLIMGAALHDLGKIEEYDINSFSFQLTDKGKLIGHISLGKEIIDKLTGKITDFPAALKMTLDHIILTHHGQKEWGSPEVPKTAEAFALFHADLLSARLRQFTQIVENEREQDAKWSSWDRFLERSIYLGDKDNISFVKEK